MLLFWERKLLSSCRRAYCDALHLARYPSQHDPNAFKICDFATGALVGHVGGHDLTEGMASLLDDLTEGVDYTMNALSLAQNSYIFPHSKIGYPIEVTIRFLVKLNAEKSSILLSCFNAVLIKIEA